MNVDYALVLFVSTIVTGIIAGLDRILWQADREKVVEGLRRQLPSGDKKNGKEKNGKHAGKKTSNKNKKKIQELEKAIEESAREPVLIEYSKAFFPVLLIVFVLRSFLFEPFQIPSGSMIPTLKVGDFILVNKFTYGIRIPLLGHILVPVNELNRGEIVVFRFPKDPSKHYIKRLIGLPGDYIKYVNKRLSINGELVKEKFLDATPSEILLTQTLSDQDFTIQQVRFIPGQNGEWVVPEGHYFMMGDNRDNSHDSRAWDYVPEKYIVGRAIAVWMHKEPGWNIPSFAEARAIE